MRITIECETDKEFEQGVAELMPAIGELTKGLVAVYIEKGDCSWIDNSKMPVGSELWEKEVINIVRDNVGLIRRGTPPSEFVVDGAEYLEQLRTGAGMVEDRSLEMMMGEADLNLTPCPSPVERGVRPNFFILDDTGDGRANEEEIKSQLDKWSREQRWEIIKDKI